MSVVCQTWPLLISARSVFNKRRAVNSINIRGIKLDSHGRLCPPVEEKFQAVTLAVRRRRRVNASSSALLQFSSLVTVLSYPAIVGSWSQVALRYNLGVLRFCNFSESPSSCGCIDFASCLDLEQKINAVPWFGVWLPWSPFALVWPLIITISALQCCLLLGSPNIGFLLFISFNS